MPSTSQHCVALNKLYVCAKEEIHQHARPRSSGHVGSVGRSPFAHSIKCIVVRFPGQAGGSLKSASLF